MQFEILTGFIKFVHDGKYKRLSLTGQFQKEHRLFVIAVGKTKKTNCRLQKCPSNYRYLSKARRDIVRYKVVP